MGYNVQLKPVACNVMAVTKEELNGGAFFHAVSDPRDIGTTAAQ